MSLLELKAAPTRPPAVAAPFGRLVRTRRIALTCMALGVLVALVLSCTLGAYGIAPARVVEILFTWGGGAEALPPDAAVLLGIRLPRALFALVVGAGLGVAGAVLQGLFRNPLADPALIGVSSGSAAGAVLALLVMPAGVGLAGAGPVAAAALVGGLAAVFTVYRLATRAGHTSMVHMLLFGIAVNTLAGAVIGVVVFAADEAQLRSITLWMMGSLAGGGWHVLGLTGGLTLIGAVALVRKAGDLNAFCLGEAQARHLGVDVAPLKRSAIAWCTLIVAAGVAFSGMIAFVGLVVPHLVRLLMGPDHRAVLPGSALLGACLLVLADTLARIALAPAELPIGLVTSLIGAPFLIVLLASRTVEGAR